MFDHPDIQFALTDSSARKLKRGSANLLAGRAFLHHLYPLTFQELEHAFSLKTVLAYSTLPAVCNLENVQDKRAFLHSYALTYY